jgi:hypothetical protein
MNDESMANRRSSRVHLPATLAIGFTGQRVLLDETRSRSLLLGFLRERCGLTKGVVYGVSTIAEGSDLLFTEACLELGIPLQLLLPMPVNELGATFDASIWERAKRVLEQATAIEIIGSPGSIEENYYECGIEIVQRSGLLVALWGGEPCRGASGADPVVSFAEKIGRPVIWIQCENSATQIFNQAAEHKLLEDPELDFLNDLPDCGVSCSDGSPTDIAVQWFQKIDANASRLAPQVRRLASIPIIYTAAAALLSGAASKSSAGVAWIAVSAALGVTAAALPVILRLDRRQAMWARTRTAAEVCRSVLALWDSPFQCEVIGPEIGSEMAGTLTSLRFLKMKALSLSHVTLEEFKQRYRKERVLDQIEYYRNHASHAENQAETYRRVTFISIGVAILLALCWLAGTMGVTGLHVVLRGHWFGFTLSALFQGATVVAALEIVNDSSRRQRRYRELHDWLKDWDRQFDALRTWPSVLKVVVQIEKALMVELLEWRSLARNTKLPRK